jgi:hypothetical protein
VRKTSHRALEIAGRRLGSEPRTPTGGGPDELVLDFQWSGHDASWYTDGRSHSVSVAVDTGLFASLGAKEELFDELIGTIGGLPAYRISYLAQIPDPEPWLRSEVGLAWIASLRLAPTEWVHATGGRVDARFIPTSPDADVDRVVMLLKSTDSLPAPDVPDVLEETLTDHLSELGPLVRETVGLLSSDDVERGRRLALADESRLRRIVELGLPRLSTIDGELYRLDSVSDLSPQNADLAARLHDLAQAIREAELELAHRGGRGWHRMKMQQ